MCAEMNMIWLHVEASNLKLSGWVWSPCSQERTEKSYHASSLFRLAPPSPHLLITYYKSTHCSGLPFPEARAIYLLSLFSGSLGCDPGRLSYLLLDAPWSPHQSPFGSQAAKKKKTSRNSFPMSGIDCSSIFLPGHWQFLYPAASWSHLVSLHTE